MKITLIAFVTIFVLTVIGYAFFQKVKTNELREFNAKLDRHYKDRTHSIEDVQKDFGKSIERAVLSDSEEVLCVTGKYIGYEIWFRKGKAYASGISNPSKFICRSK